MPVDVALLSTLIDSNNPYLELVFIVRKEFELLKFDCIFKNHIEQRQRKNGAEHRRQNKTVHLDNRHGQVQERTAHHYNKQTLQNS